MGRTGGASQALCRRGGGLDIFESFVLKGHHRADRVDDAVVDADHLSQLRDLVGEVPKVFGRRLAAEAEEKRIKEEKKAAKAAAKAEKDYVNNAEKLVAKTPAEHVAAGPTDVLFFTVPDRLVAGKPAKIYINTWNSGILKDKHNVRITAGYNDWKLENFDTSMKPVGDVAKGCFYTELEVPELAYGLNFVLEADGQWELFEADAPTQCGLCNKRMNGAEFIRHCDTGCCKGEGRGLQSVRHKQIQNAVTRSLDKVNPNVKISSRTPAVNQMFEADPNNTNNSRRRNSSSSSSSTKLADRLLTIYNSNGMVPNGEIAIDFNCSNVTGKGREFSKAGDAASLGFENKMREYEPLD